MPVPHGWAACAAGCSYIEVSGGETKSASPPRFTIAAPFVATSPPDSRENIIEKHRPAARQWLGYNHVERGHDTGRLPEWYNVVRVGESSNGCTANWRNLVLVTAKHNIDREGHNRQNCQTQTKEGTEQVNKGK